jgi:nucleoside-diphosphate-sugar epimerase
LRALVTGGGGFLGQRIVELLLERGDSVSILNRRPYPKLVEKGVTGFQGNITNLESVLQATEQVDVVFHAAANAGYWGPRKSYWSVNVDGTRAVLDACEQNGVKKLIYTSTPSVIGYDGDVHDAPQNTPYGTRHLSYYGESKTAAEKMVLAANSHHVATVALRPHLIFGPGDPHILPRLIKRARAKRLFVVGNGQNRVDLTYVDNAAYAHLDALDALIDHKAQCAGKAYFISNDDPVSLWPWIKTLLSNLGHSTPTRQIAFRTAYRLGHIMEGAWRWGRLPSEPMMTRFLASALSQSHYYDMGPAKRDLGYRVRVPMAEATEATVQYFQQCP